MTQRDQLSERDEVLAQRDHLIQQRDQTIQQRDHLIDILTEQLKRLRHLKFGASSERFDPSQQALFEETLNADIAAVKAEIEAALAGATASPADAEVVLKPLKTAPQKPVRTGFPEHLPRVIEHVPAQHCDCPACGAALHQISTEVSEELAVKPPVYFVRHIIRPVMGCRSCEAAFSTPTQPEIIDGGMPDASLLAQILIHKYLDHLPLYRQSEIAKRSGIEPPVSTIAEWVGKSGVALIPLVDRLRQHLHRRAAIHADETPIQMLNPAPKTHGPPRAQNVQRAYLFAYRSGEIGAEPIIIFDFQTSRAGAHAAQFLTGYTGALVVDDFAGYKALFKDTPMKELACWAHARRKFLSCMSPTKARWRRKPLAARLSARYFDPAAQHERQRYRITTAVQLGCRPIAYSSDCV